MFRLVLLLIIGGGFLGYYGYREFKVSSGATTEAIEVKLQDLEKSPVAKNPHIKLQNYKAIFPDLIYQSKEKTPKKVMCAYYPIISEDHVFLQKLRELAAKYGSLEKVPEKEFPVMNQFSVLVKTKRFKTTDSFPQAVKDEKAVQGMVINEIEPLDPEAKKYISSSYPGIDFNKVLILEEGRKPTSTAASLGIMSGGGVLILLGLVTGFFSLGGKKEA